ncbi:MAG: M23 family metallopeptidase [Anaerolineales bacterium]|nr:M23 family metallopeptidase [Anaerolineales bacterium]
MAPFHFGYIVARLWRLSLLSILLLSGCAVAPSSTTTPSSTTQPPLPTALPTHTTTPTALPSPTPTAPPSATPIPPWEVCSPLEGVAIDDLANRIVNPYAPPASGSDLPHHGLDLADPGKGQIAVAGLPVQAVLPGTVAMVIDDRFPYGNAVLVETGLESAPEGWLAALQLPAPMPTLSFIPALTCPQPEILLDWDTQNRSLYLLYAHLRDAPTLQVDEEVSCGQSVGAIGDSGNALNPHLHLEVRIGPAGVRFGSFAHYDASASPEEMHSYCVWRVSGWFQHLDPLHLFNSP